MRHIQKIFPFVVLGVFAGCHGSLDVGSVELASLVCSNSNTRLLAGQHINVGTIQVTQDEQYLCVSFQISDSAWYIKETHLALAASPDLLPQNGSGNPQVGPFPYKHTGLHTQSDLFCVDYTTACAAT